MDCNENTSCAVEETDRSLKVNTNSACLEEGENCDPGSHSVDDHLSPIHDPNDLLEPVDGIPKPASSSVAGDSSLIPSALEINSQTSPTVENTTDHDIPGFEDFDSNIAAVIENATSSLSETRGQSEAVAEIPFFRHPPHDTTILLNVLRFHRNYSAWSLLALGTTVTVFTLFYAWEASMPSNTFRALLWNNPQNTIFVINLLGHFSVLFLELLIVTACDNLRWSLSRTGTSLLNFTSLTGSTSWLGLIQLLFSRKPRTHVKKSFNFRNSSYRFWSAQRYTDLINLLTI